MLGEEGAAFGCGGSASVTPTAAMTPRVPTAVARRPLLMRGAFLTVCIAAVLVKLLMRPTDETMRRNMMWRRKGVDGGQMKAKCEFVDTESVEKRDARWLEGLLLSTVHP